MAFEFEIKTMPSAEEVYDLCTTYVSQLESFVDGRLSHMPEPHSLCDRLLFDGSILKAEVEADTNGPYIAATIRHVQERNPRKFDPWYFACCRLLEAPGGRIQFHLDRKKSAPNPLYYLRYCPPWAAEERERIFLMRIIAAMEPGITTKQLPAEHHDYRRYVFDRRYRKQGRRPQLGRPDAIRVAKMLWRLNVGDTISADEFEAELKRAFDVADAVHERLYGANPG